MNLNWQRHLDFGRLIGRRLVGPTLLRLAVGGWICCAYSANAPSASAQLPASDRSVLAEQIRAAKTQLDPDRLPDLAAAETAVLVEAAALNDYLTTRTSDENRAAWFAYLQTNDLIEVLTATADEVDRAEQARLAEALQFRMTRNLDGLQMEPIARLRAAVARLRAAIRYRDRERTLRIFSSNLDKLAVMIEAMGEVPTPDEAAMVSQVLTLLDEAGQGEQLIATLRSRFANPNIRVSIGEPLIRQLATRPVDRNQAVNDCILGTRLVGSATLQGNVSADLLPSAGMIRIQLTLNANFSSRSVGYNGPVSLNTVGYGNVMSTRTILLGEQGIALEPVVTQASLKSDITNINHRLRLVRKIAGRRAAEQKPQAEQISVRKLEQQVGDEFDRETAMMADGDFSQSLLDSMNVFARLGLTPPERQLYASDDTMFLDLRQGEPTQVLAVQSPPSLTRDAFVGVQFHESAVDNVAARVLAGRTMTNQQLELLLGNLRPKSAGTQPAPFVEAPLETEPEAAEFETPESLRDEEGDDEQAEPEATADDSDEVAPFEIDFAELRPLVFEARDDSIRIGIRGTRFSQNDRELKRAMEIAAVYVPCIFEDKVFFLRKGNVDIDLSRGRKLSVYEAGLKRNIQNAFDEAFPKAFLNRPIELPFERVGGMTIYPRSVTARDGWLSVGLR